MAARALLRAIAPLLWFIVALMVAGAFGLMAADCWRQGAPETITALVFVFVWGVLAVRAMPAGAA